MTNLPAADTYKLIASTIIPRPIAWVTSLDDRGGLNAAPFSFFNAMAGSPPLVAIGIARKADGTLKDTARNIEHRREWVVNMVSMTQAEAMNVTAADFPYGVDELRQAGLDTLPCAAIATPRIADAPAALECRLHSMLDLGQARLIVLGDVMALHVRDDAVLDRARCHIDGAKLDLIGRMYGAGGYVRATDLFTLPRPKGP